MDVVLQWMEANGVRARTYLGDGVYAAWDNYQIWLLVDREGTLNSIALDQRTLDSLVAYTEKITTLAQGLKPFEEAPEQLEEAPEQI